MCAIVRLQFAKKQSSWESHACLNTSAHMNTNRVIMNTRLNGTDTSIVSSQSANAPVACFDCSPVQSGLLRSNNDQSIRARYPL
jgi:predicted NodU family carbamoyl transferase